MWTTGGSKFFVFYKNNLLLIMTLALGLSEQFIKKKITSVMMGHTLVTCGPYKNTCVVIIMLKKTDSLCMLL